MDPKKYLELAKKVEIEVVGIGKQYAHSVHPSLEELEKRCKRLQSGSFSFYDIAAFPVKRKLVANKIKLYYSGELVGMRTIPEIQAEPGDTISVEWTLTVNHEWKIVDLDLHTR